jgi:hypothetical protein
MKKLSGGGTARQLDRLGAGRRGPGSGLSALGAGLYGGLTMELGQERVICPFVHCSKEWITANLCFFTLAFTGTSTPPYRQQDTNPPLSRVGIICLGSNSQSPPLPKRP